MRLCPSRIVTIASASVLACSLSAPFVTKSHAKLITFEATGTLTAFDGPALAPLAIGQHYFATYTFDSGTVGTSTTFGKTYLGAITSARFSIGAYSGILAKPADTAISVEASLADSYTAVLGRDIGTPGVVDAPPVTGPLGDLLPVLVDLVDLVDFFPPVIALSSTDLPLVPPDITKFDTAGWVINFMATDGSLFGRARGTLDSLTLASVSEPATLVIFAVGLLGLLLMRFNKRAHRQSGMALT